MNRLSIRILVQVGVLALLSVAPVAGQQAGGTGSAAPRSSPAVPDTSPGAVRAGLLAAVNAGEAEIRRFVAAHASPDLSGRVTATQYSDALRKLREQSGGMET
jgi:hypothetical protein